MLIVAKSRRTSPAPAATRRALGPEAVAGLTADHVSDRRLRERVTASGVGYVEALRSTTQDCLLHDRRLALIRFGGDCGRAAALANLGFVMLR